MATGLLSLALAASIAVLLWKRWMVEALIETIRNFRGGPPTAMHPSPVNDGALPRRRFRRDQ
jgi:hypothetical protein